MDDRKFPPMHSQCELPSLSAIQRLSGQLPGVGQSPPGGSPPGSETGSGRQPCNAERVVMAGGALQELMMHPSVIPFEQRFVRNPLPGIYSANPARTFTFEIGSFQVPVSMALAVADWKFTVYRLSGVVALETIIIAPGMSTLNIGVDFNVSQYHQGQVMYELLPINPSVVQAAFSPRITGGTILSSKAINPVSATPVVSNNGTQSTLNSTTQQNAFVQGAGIGSALMPISERDHQGPARMPFTYYARDSQSIQMRISVFQRLGYPVAYFEARVAGYLIPISTLDETMKAIAPCNPGSGI